MNKIAIIALILVSCKTIPAPVQKDVENVEIAGPMSCTVTGKVVRILSIPKDETNSICAQHPCRAKILILNVHNCGQAVPLILNTGDTIEANFTYTLSDTKKVFQNSDAYFPGMKQGTVFTAQTTELLKAGNSIDYIIGGYKVNKQ